MIALFIPFFLAARIAVNENDWPYGPEYIFEVHTNITGMQKDDENIKTSRNIASKLYCRPKGSDKLSCHMEDETITDVDPYRLLKGNRSKEITEEPFEIKFNDRGVDYLIFRERTHTLKMNSIRTVVEQLNIGADLNGIPDGVLDVTENSTAGECEISFNIYHHPMQGSPRQTQRRLYELESLPQLNKIPGETIELRKIRNLNNCSDYSFAYDSYGNTMATSTPSPFKSNLISLITSIVVSDVGFRGTTTEAFTKYLEERDAMYYITYITTVTLRDIRPATKELPVIPNPQKTSITANSMLESIESAK